MTEFLFRTEPYAKGCEAVVTSVVEGRGVELDRSVFYAMSGGQAGDTGWLIGADGTRVQVVDTVHPERDRGRVLHVLEDSAVLPRMGEAVTLELDWERRHRMMRMHTALHLLSVVLPFGVTGGSITAEKGRLDFDMPEPPEDLDAVAESLSAIVARDLPVSDEWITDAELLARPEMVKTMAVQPPMGQGRVRLVRIGTPEDTVDLQPCGGTHVRTTGEIGPLRIGKIEKKGRNNRRVNLHFAD